MKSSLTAAMLLASALLIWTGILWGSMQLVSNATARAEAAAQHEAATAKRAYAARLAALAADTKPDRDALETVVRPDIVSIVKTLEDAGKAAGVRAQVSDALPEGIAAELPGGGSIQAVSFVVEAHGTFAALFHAAQVFEHIPLAAGIEAIDIEKAPIGVTQPWNMTIRIRVFTSASIST